MPQRCLCFHTASRDSTKLKGSRLLPPEVPVLPLKEEARAKRPFFEGASLKSFPQRSNRQSSCSPRRTCQHYPRALWCGRASRLCGSCIWAGFSRKLRNKLSKTRARNMLPPPYVQRRGLGHSTLGFEYRECGSRAG